MRVQFIARAAAVFGATLVAVLAASPASANVTGVPINPGNVPTTAAGFGSHECSAQLGGNPPAGTDIWVFNLPDQDRDFVSVTASFDTNGNGIADHDVVIDGTTATHAIVRLGTSKAWVATTAGWTLVGATATVTGSAPAPGPGRRLQFVLTHTCVSTESTPSPSPRPSLTRSPTPSPSPKPSKSEHTPGGGTGPGDGGTLPVTGERVGWLAGAGALLVLGGAALVLTLRRRRTTFTSDA